MLKGLALGQQYIWLKREEKGKAVYKLVLNISSTALLRPQEQVATLGEHLVNWLSSETVKRLGVCCSHGLGCYPHTALSPSQNATWNPLLNSFLLVFLCGICTYSCSYVHMCLKVRGTLHHILSVSGYNFYTGSRRPFPGDNFQRGKNTTPNLQESNFQLEPDPSVLLPRTNIFSASAVTR